MGEIKVNKYVRTRAGHICKITNIDENGLIYWNKIQCGWSEQQLEDIIVKHSKQLIDLIEVNDLIYFENKLQNSLENEEMIIHIFDNDTLEGVKQAIEKGEIELLEILTHEQFEKNSYKVGGEEWD